MYLKMIPNFVNEIVLDSVDHFQTIRLKKNTIPPLLTSHGRSKEDDCRFCEGREEGMISKANT